MTAAGRPPFELLPDIPLAGDGPAAGAFRAAGCPTLRAAAEWAWRLPYGRNGRRDDLLAPVREGRGTCSSKHAALSLLLTELGVAHELKLGVYLMSERNTPGVGKLLAAAGLETIPEAHCYLEVGGERFDCTRVLPEGAEPVEPFLETMTIAPMDVAEVKPAFHRGFLARWLAAGHAPGLSPEQAWSTREACILALGE